MFLIEAADAPKYVKGKRPVPVIESTEDAAGILGGRVMIRKKQPENNES